MTTNCPLCNSKLTASSGVRPCTICNKFTDYTSGFEIEYKKCFISVCKDRFYIKNLEDPDGKYLCFYIKITLEDILSDKIFTYLLFA